MRRLPLLLLPPLALLAALPGPAQPPGESVTAYRNADILPVAGKPIPRGTLLVKGGKIAAIGPADAVTVPAGAKVVDLAGKVVIPGMVDTHSHLGIYPRPHVPAHSDGNEMTGPLQSGLRAVDAIWPDDPGLRMAIAGGITTANIMPGSGNVVGGQTLYVKLRGDTVEAMRVDAGVLGGLKMANGENPKGYGRKGQAPFTRMKIAALQRDLFLKAREYKRKWDEHRKKTAAREKSDPPETDLSLEPVVEVLDRKRTVHFHCHRADDILTAVRLSEEFGFELVLQHCTEGYRVADELAKRKIPASLTLVDSPGGKAETANLLEENAAVLAKAGVSVAINTDDFITESRFFLRTGSIAVRGGMSEEQALAALTLNPARMLHLDSRLGTLEAGKDADFVVLSGSPFSVYTQVLETYIDGVRRYAREDRKDWSYQAGGFALADAGKLPPTPAVLKTPAPAKVPEAVVPEKGDGDVLVIQGGRVHTVGPLGTIEDGVVVVRDGKIAAVGPRGKVAIPAGAKVLRAAEVTPGLVDAHAVVPLSGGLNIPADQDADENSDPNQAELRVLDGFNPNEGLLQFLRDNGITLVHATPGRTNVIAGQSGVFRTAGSTATSMAVKFPAAVLVNLGETPKETYSGKAPKTRMATANILRTALQQAKAHAAAREKATDAKPLAPNPKHEALDPVLQGRLPLWVSAHRADDLLTGLRVAGEFNAPAVLDLATEAYLMPDAIRKAKVPVVVHPTMQRAGGSMETLHSQVANAAVLADKGIPLAICTGFEGYVPKQRNLRTEAALAAVNGLGPDRALKAVTLDAAKLLGVADRFGSLEVGKAADVILYDGDPFENATHVTHTVIDGRTVFDRAEYLKLPFARRVLPLIEGGSPGCCLGAW